jgi:glycolate oxidase iron-sulfur subunit
MQHRMPTTALGPMGPAMAKAVEGCVHCGFCLPVCPTYQTLGEEMDSPRGRIFLMKEVLEGNLPAAEAAPYVDRCLGCLACVTACPSGVEYGALLTPYRARVESELPRSLVARAFRRVVLDTLMNPARLRPALMAAGAAGIFRALLPAQLAVMLDLAGTAERGPARALPAVTPARGPRRARVALLQGCAQQVLAPRITAAAAHVLAANGVDVHLLPPTSCCGALAAHAGRMDLGRPRAQALMADALAVSADIDAVLTTTAGCGSAMHEYPLWFAGTPHEGRATQVAARTVDVTVFLAELGLVTPLSLPPLRVAYHDACHLAHAQGVRRPPRALLERIEGLSLVSLPESDTCCGSAGIYNVEQPEIAAALGGRKAAAVSATGATIVATGNIGCMAQMSTHLRARPAPAQVEVLHTIELLARALPHA